MSKTKLFSVFETEKMIIAYLGDRTVLRHV
jgi:hypothetical protein